MDSNEAGQIVLLLVLLVLSAFFSSAETSFTTINKIRIRTLAEDGDKRAIRLLQITSDRTRLLGAILIGNNIVNLAASSIATMIAYNFGGYAVAIATGIITLLILLFGEIVPKTAASLYADKMALAYTPVMYGFIKVITPLISAVNALSRGIMFLIRLDPNAKPDSMTETELRTIMDVGHETGVIEAEEREMIDNVFDFGDAKAKDVMVPRIHVTFAEEGSTYEELLKTFRQDKFTRLPIYSGTTDNVIGTINMKDLLLYDSVKDFHIKDILREPYFTYEFKNISELLVEMRDASYNIAIVLDEYGETAGLITLEDILEEIVGEIHDEYDDAEEKDLIEITPHEYLVEGSMNLDDLNDETGLTFSSEDYDSIAGFIIEGLDRLPRLGDEITTADGIRLLVEKLDKNRIEKVHIFIPEDYEKPGKKFDISDLENA